MLGHHRAVPTSRPIYVARYAGFWRRFAAFLIDGMIVGTASGILTATFGDGSGGSIAGLLAWLYFAWMESSSSQGTIGKMALGIYVTDMNGLRISFMQATLRFFAKLISAITLVIGFVMVGWTERKQALHDMIAGTLVYNR